MVNGLIGKLPLERREKIEEICAVLYEMQMFNIKALKRIVRILKRHRNNDKLRRLLDEEKNNAAEPDESVARILAIVVKKYIRE